MTSLLENLEKDIEELNSIVPIKLEDIDSYIIGPTSYNYVYLYDGRYNGLQVRVSSRMTNTIYLTRTVQKPIPKHATEFQVKHFPQLYTKEVLINKNESSYLKTWYLTTSL